MTKTEKASTEKPPYTSAERDAIKSYQGALNAGRYFKLFDSGSQFVRLISGDDPTPLPMSFLSDDFKRYCRDNGLTFPKANPPPPDYLSAGLRIVTGIKFHPNGPDVLRARHSRHAYVNTYQRFEPSHAAIDLSPLFLDFLRRLFPVPEELRTFSQYIGHALVKPEERPSWHLMLPSEQGVGKGFLFNDIITPLFSKQTFVVKSFSAVTGQFGATVLEGSMFTLLDDCKTGSESTQTQMKSLLSEERIYVEHKGKQGGMREIFTRLILASNEDVPTPVDDQTRRWWIPQKLGYCNGLKGKAGQRERQARIKALSGWLKQPGAIEAVYTYFATYPLCVDGELPEFDPKNVPITASFEQMVTKSETPEQSFAVDWLEEHSTKVLKLEELQAAFVGAKLSKQGNSTIAELLAECGYQKDILTVPSRARWWFPVSMTKLQAEAVLTAAAAEKAGQPVF